MDDHLIGDRPPALLPLPLRVQLAHAAVQAVVEDTDSDALHIKGYAAPTGYYRPGRPSTDVDVLVRPEHCNRLVDRLLAHGWVAETDFATGSLFEHARSLRHEQWGLLDVHRLFPGLGMSPGEAFDRLWTDHRQMRIAGYPCPVPAPLHHAMIIALHSARDLSRGRTDLEHLRDRLGPDRWDEVLALAVAFRAEVPMAAATDTLDEYRDRPEHDLWAVLSQGGTRSQEWLARLKAARGPGEMLHVLRSALAVNTDHLAMRLGHQPSPEEIRAESRERWRHAARDLAEVLRRRTGRSRGKRS